MKRTVPLILFSISLSCLSLLQGCSLFQHSATPTSLINRRYKQLDASVHLDGEAAPIELYMQTALTIPATDTGKTIWDLDGRGQAAILSKLTKPDDASDLLNAKYQITNPDPTSLDLTAPGITVVLSVRLKEFYQGLPNQFSLGDRLEYLRVKFTLDEASARLARFVSWDKVSTQYGQIRLGSIGFSNTKNLTVNPSIPLFAGGASGNLSLGSFQSTTQLQEQDTLQQRLVTLSGVLQDKDFLIEQHGNSKLPIEGNTTVNLTVDFPSKDAVGFFIIDSLKKKEQYNSPDKIHPKQGQMQFPPKGNLTGTLTAEYAVRHIVNGVGADTYTEGDDQVSYLYGTITQNNVRLLTRKDTRMNFWGLTLHEDQWIKIQDTLSNGNEVNRDLVFQSSTEANAFANWLRDQLPKYKRGERNKLLTIGGYRLCYIDGRGQEQLLTNSTDIATLTTLVHMVARN